MDDVGRLGVVDDYYSHGVGPIGCIQVGRMRIWIREQKYFIGLPLGMFMRAMWVGIGDRVVKNNYHFIDLPEEVDELKP